eukprot:74684_1
MSAFTDAESEELYNGEVEDIVDEIKGTFNNQSLPQSERNRRVSVLLTEMEQYTQPLIIQISALTVHQKHTMLCRVARLFPEIIQTEIKSAVNTHTPNKNNESTQTSDEEESKTDLTKVLNRLGYGNVDELYRHSKPSQIFGECVNEHIQRKVSEKATSSKVEKQLNEWKVQREKNEAATMRKLVENDKSEESSYKPKKNNAKKVAMMMGVSNVENENDYQAICNASSKALRKLV